VASTAVVHARLLEWYAAQARDLPWRRTRDAYAILVAEVMLQQTQVDRVIPKWHAWLARFPTLASLAEASRADAIREWQGLGYNLRAVRLHAIACQVLAEYQGHLPRSVDVLLRLKGIGRYTAGAVACFAYEQPVAMVDTNVRRVLSRVFGLEPGAIEGVADTLVPAQSAYAWNQALMDLGATVCRTQRPLCLVCPLLAECGGPRPMRSKPVTEFRSSSRYFRGRIIDFLRALPTGTSVFLDDLVDEAHTSVAVVRQLADDGLLRVDNENRVSLPE
jgi:A/G-specific adenine glycosylase